MPERDEDLFRQLVNPATLPPTPDAASRAMGLLRDPDCGFQELQQCIVRDPALVAMILKVANSPLYAAQSEFTTINGALSYMGFRRLRSMLYTYFLRTVMQGIGGRIPGHERMWAHALSTGAYAMVLAIQTGLADENECFTAGLIHDLGRLILALQKPDLIERIHAWRADHGGSLRDAEIKTMGFDHQDIGREVASRWHFPEPIVHAVHCHHDTAGFAGLPALTRLVLTANLLAHGLEPGPESAAPARQGDELMHRLELDEATRQGVHLLQQDKLRSLNALF